MMNTKINYPYPVIRSYKEDYKNTIFKGSLSVGWQPDGYLISLNFSVNNDGINKLISLGILTYAVEVICTSTWYRKLYIISDDNDIYIDSKLVHELVEVIPCIVAKQKITDFKNDDFEEEYQGIIYEINAGDIIGIGERRTFDALYQNDVVKNGKSIVEIRHNEVDECFRCDYNGSVIEISLPLNQYNNYIDCGYNKTKYKLLNAIVVVPALVGGIDIIYQDENCEKDENRSQLSSKSWYKTIKTNLKTIAENNEQKYNELLSDSFAAAELLLKNNSAEALDFLNRM